MGVTPGSRYNDPHVTPMHVEPDLALAHHHP
jgi:hypothetical protein